MGDTLGSGSSDGYSCRSGVVSPLGESLGSIYGSYGGF